MIRNTLVVISFIFLFISCETSKTYYDKNWKICSKEQASFYRIIEKKSDTSWLFKDFYIDNQLQGQGVSLSKTEEIWDGNLTWYHKNGRIQDRVRFKNGEIIGYYVAVDGYDNTQEGYKEEDIYYLNHPPYLDDAISKNTEESSIYYSNSNQIAVFKKRNPKNNYHIYFNRNGDTIGQLLLNKHNGKIRGKEISFYMQNDSCSSIKTINTYNNFQLTDAVTYNKSENIIAEGTYKNGTPFSGAFYSENCYFFKIKNFEKGILSSELTFDALGNPKGRLLYHKGVIDYGSQFLCDTYASYKNGKLNGSYLELFSTDINQIKSEYHYIDNIKNGPFVLYNNFGDTLAKGEYRNNELSGILTKYKYNRTSTDKSLYFEYSILKKSQSVSLLEIKKYSTQHRNLLKTYTLEIERYKFPSFLNNPLTNLSERDLNFDGINDLNFTSSHNHLLKNSYYIFDEKLGHYIYHKALSKAQFLDIDEKNKHLISYQYKNQKKVLDSMIYNVKNNIVEKVKHYQKILSTKKEDIKTTQIYPTPYEEFPLLHPDIPSVQLTQGNKTYSLDYKTIEHIKLDKSPFSILFPSYPYQYKNHFYGTKINVTDNKKAFRNCKENTLFDDIPCLSIGTGIASLNHNLHINDEGHLYLLNNEDVNRIQLKKKLSKEVLLYAFNVTMIEGTLLDKNFSVSEHRNTFYLNIVIDRNLNRRIEKGELYKVVLAF